MLRPFRFPLQKVLDYRLQLEEEARQVMARAQEEYQQKVQATQQIRDVLANLEQEMYGKNAPPPQEMWLWRNYQERLQADVQVAEQKALQSARKLNKARREVVNRSKERKLLEKLKQNQMVRHVKEEERLEQNELDEMATLRYRHNAF